MGSYVPNTDREQQAMIATGSVPSVPPIKGADLKGVVTSDHLLNQDKPLKSLIIIGGGVIGMEFASVFSSLGCQVTVIEALDRIIANMKEFTMNSSMMYSTVAIIFILGSSL